MKFIKWFDQLRIEDVPLVGGKNASLGEMYSNLTAKGINIPNGFAVTAEAYFYLLDSNNGREEIHRILEGLDTADMNNLQEKGRKVRDFIMNLEFPEDLRNGMIKAYEDLSKAYACSEVDVAVRSSATAEDLPDASFAGQQETYLNIKGVAQLLDACRKCFASLFTNRAISYREDKGFGHFDVGLSIGVQKMVRSDKASSGVMFSIDTESGFRDVMLITGAWGLGENVVQGAVDPDEYYVHKPTLKKGFKPIISRKAGSKTIMMVYDLEGHGKTVKNKNVPEEMRKQFVLNNEEILTLAEWGAALEDYYSEKRKANTPMDMEWAKDGETGQLFIVQARPETVHSTSDTTKMVKYTLRSTSSELISGASVGNKIGAGRVKVIKSPHEITRFNKGEVLVTDMTDPDWEPIMKIASAIVTNRGGRTCFTGDTTVLTDKGFMTMEEIHSYEGDLMVPSLNRETLKMEWKNVLGSMKRKADVMQINASQTGRMKNNFLRLTPDHKMLTYSRRNLVDMEIRDILNQDMMLLLAQKVPRLKESTLKERQLAYLLGAISTDGQIYLTDKHGEVRLIQKPTPEKQAFIETVAQYFYQLFDKLPGVSEKKISRGVIREKEVCGNANAYRVYGKQVAEVFTEEKSKLAETLLLADDEFILNFLAGVIDGDGSINGSRINVYCSGEKLLQSIVIGCLRLGIIPQISNNRNICNVQIVEQIDRLLAYTKRVVGKEERKMGTRFFSARQLLGDIQEEVNFKGQVKPCVSKNLLMDADKIKRNIFPMCSNKVRDEMSLIMKSDTRMMRVSLHQRLGIREVYNIEVEDNHNYIVFTDRYTPVLVNNCHAAIVSRELGIPCIVGTGSGTQTLHDGQEVTVDCSQGEKGTVWEGILEFQKEELDLGQIPETKTKVMVNIGSPEEAFKHAALPQKGVGLAREEFIISSHIKIHPLALLHMDRVDEDARKQIEELTFGYADKAQYFVDKLAEGIGMIAAAFYPNPVIVRMSDFKSNEYANLIGGEPFEPKEENPMIGWRGASRYYDDRYREGFALECRAFLKVRGEFGLKNVKAMIPFCRTVGEARKVLDEMARNGLRQGEDGLEVIGMCEIPSNVILANDFLDVFDGFSIGSNDLAQLALGMDRDSDLISSISDERDPAVISLVLDVIKKAKAKKKYIGICGQAPSDFPEFGDMLVDAGITSISLNPDKVVEMIYRIAEREKGKKKARRK